MKPSNAVGFATASQIAPFAYTMGISFVAARVLGPERMGRQSFIAFAVLSATGFAGGGFSAAVTRDVAATLGAHPYYAAFLSYVDEIDAHGSAWSDDAPAI